MKMLTIENCRECKHAKWLGHPDYDECELTGKEIDLLDIPDWCPLPDYDADHETLARIKRELHDTEKPSRA